MLREENLEGYIAHFESMVDDRELINMYRSEIGDTKEIELAIAKHLIDDFCKKEYDIDSGADYTELTDVCIAYTETEDGLFPIQTSVDLVHNAIFTKVDNVVVSSTIRSSLRELIMYELKYLDFSDLVYVEKEKLYPIYRKRLVGKDIFLDYKPFRIESISDTGEVFLRINAGSMYGMTETAPLEKVVYAYYQQELEKAPQQTNNSICFKSENIDGIERTWEFKNVSDLEAAWLSEDCDLPSLEDKIYDIQIYGSEPCLFTFDELLRYLDLIADMED